ncbi:MAG: class II fructose-bisphosphate aldolase [Sphaerochaetaceae bacterium]
MSDLVTLREVMAIAEKDNVAIPAFNIDTIEITQAVLEECEKENHPVIVAVGQAAIRDGKLEMLSDVVHRYIKHMHVPVVLHLDHGQNFTQVMQALKCGYSSVMIDGSKYSLAENIAMTKETIDAAYAVGASVEAELGAILGTEDDITNHTTEDYLVKVEDVKTFISQVHPDALAIGIGNKHGFYQGRPHLDFQRLQEVKDICDIPLVLHGGSGIPEDMLREAIKIGIRKINVATEIRFAYSTGMVKGAANNDYYEMVKVAKQSVHDMVASKTKIFFA